MADKGEQWERGVLEKIALAGIKEQRSARRWGIFFKLLTYTLFQLQSWNFQHLYYLNLCRR